MQKITPCLWFAHDAEEAANFYVSVFKNSKLGAIIKYASSAKDVGMTEGEVLTVEFSLDGQDFLALNGGPVFKFSEATSFIVDCKDQEEMDYYTNSLSAVPESEQCGWVKDKYGLSWQITATWLTEVTKNPKDAAAYERVMKAMMEMKRLSLAELQAAYDQE